MPFYDPPVYSTPRAATRALDAQQPNGFGVDLAGGFCVFHPTPTLWTLWRKGTDQAEPDAWGTIREVVAAWERLRG